MEPRMDLEQERKVDCGNLPHCCSSPSCRKAAFELCPYSVYCLGTASLELIYTENTSETFPNVSVERATRTADICFCPLVYDIVSEFEGDCHLKHVNFSIESIHIILGDSQLLKGLVWALHRIHRRLVLWEP